MAERKPISKKTRFEVFKRDSFTCQYCGAKAPDVILEVDHIVPVSKGGDNSILNLVTSCRNCNRGKGARVLSENAAVEKQRKELEEMNAKREQLKLMLRWKEELLKLEEQQIDAIDSVIKSLRNCCLKESGRQEIRRLIKIFGFDEVYKSTEIAFSNGRYDNEYALSKIGGICWNRRKEREEDA